MQVDYLDLLEEIEELTTVDGFVAACLEIKGSMFFYERELMLAAYTASLELLTTVALFGAALGDGTELKKVEEQIIRCSEGLLADLAEYHLPLISALWRTVSCRVRASSSVCGCRSIWP